MKTDTEITNLPSVQAEGLPAGSMLAIIAQAATDPSVNIDKMERLLAMAQTIRKEEREAAFARDLNALQAEIPQIEKGGVIMAKDKVTVRSRYSLIEDIDIVVRPLLQKYGFSVSFNEESVAGDNYTISCKLLHKDGHSDTKRITLPLDKNEFRTRIQDRGSTETFAHRKLLFMHLNIVQRGEDNDGQGSGKTISETQERDLLALMEEVKQDKQRFLNFFKIEKVADLPEKELAGAIRDLERKRK